MYKEITYNYNECKTSTILKKHGYACTFFLYKENTMLLEVVKRNINCSHMVLHEYNYSALIDKFS